METFSHVIRSSLPNYLRALPVPETIGGFFRLSLREWVSLTPLGLFIAGTGYLTYRTLSTQGIIPGKAGASAEKKKPNKINETIQKDNPKIVDTFDIEEVGERKCYCRCWKSSKFPYCDGAHNKHNEETGDNIGPLLIVKQKK